MGTSIALAMVAFSSLSTFWWEEPTDWPDAVVGRVHLYEGGALGACRRESPDVPALGGCGEAFGSLEVRVSRRLRLELDLGVGFEPASSSGDLELGALRRSGGPLFLSGRVALSFDFTRLFFLRLGPQLELSWVRDLSRFAPGARLTLDHGTRLGRFLEVGFRVSAGVDGIAASSAPQYTTAAALAVQLFTRVLLQ